MGIVLNTNMSALVAQNALRKTQSRVDSTMERLSSGLRINRAADDAAGLAISERLRTQVNGLNQAQRNVQDGISVMQTADGGLDETHAILQRMRTLAVQAANGTNSKDNLQQIQAEMNQLMKEIDRIADSTQFNGHPLLDGTFVKKNLQVGANAGDTTTVTIGYPISAAVRPTSPAFALWNLDQDDTRDNIPNPFEVQQSLTTSGETVSASVTLTTLPADAEDLAAALNADPSFSAHFTASTGDIVEADGTLREDANLIIDAIEPGDGDVTVPDTDSMKTKSRSGTDEVPVQ